MKVSERLDRRFEQILELTLFVVTGPTLLCAYVVVVWALIANLSVTGSFPWSTGPLSNWIIWLVLALLLHALTSKTQAYLNRSGKNYIPENMSEDLIPARLKLGYELSQEGDEQFGPAWATASTAVGTGARS